MTTSAAWIDDLRPKLERKNIAIIAALKDFAAAIGDESPTCWLDLSDETVIVHALTTGWLHIFSGTPDQLPDETIPGKQYSSNCDCTPVRITGDATFELSVKSTATLALHAPTGGPPTVGNTDRTWIFHLGQKTLTLHAQTSQPVDEPPDELAKALVAQVLAAHDGRYPGA